MVKPTTTGETVTIAKYEDVMQKREKQIRENLEKCMNAPKLEPTLENGYIHDNKDHLHELVSKLGRRRNFQYYFHDPYKH